MSRRPTSPISPASSAPLAIGLGETLYDCFPHATILGGAPVNFTVHAHAMLSRVGGGAAPATRVGADPLGDRFLSELAARGVSPVGVQRDAELPTGRVVVGVDGDGHASYRFEDGVAWDRLEWTDGWERLAHRCDAVAFGTLAQRSDASRRAITEFLNAAPGAIRLFDVNLRGGFYSPGVIRRSLELANAVKLNAEELTEVGGLLGLLGRREPGADGLARALGAAFGLEWLALTRGAAGTVLYIGEERFEGEAPPAPEPAPGADSVGAGDACCAGLVTGMLLGWPPGRTLELANQAGAFVASRAGATPRLAESLIELIGPIP